MTGLESYETYLALKLHFKSKSYDFLKFRGKTRVSRQSYEKRKDKFLFEKVAAIFPKNKYINKLLVEFKSDPSFWVRGIMTKDNEDRYESHMRFMEDPGQSFTKELTILSKILEEQKISFNKCISQEEDAHCLLFRLYLKKTFSPEFLLIINSAIPLFKIMNKREVICDPIWEEAEFFLQKYRQFILNCFPEKAVVRQLMLDVLAKS